MDVDLDHMSKEELTKLRNDVDRALATVEERRRAEARAAAERAAREHGYSLDDVVAAQKKAGKKNPPKYRNPANPVQTWSGRGRQPAWIKEALQGGGSLDDFAI